MPKQHRNSYVGSLRPGDIFHFITHSPDVVIIPHIHSKQNNKSLNMLMGGFSQGQVHRVACLPKELFPCFPYLFSNYPFPKELKCVKISLTWSFCSEITLSVFRHQVFTSLNVKWALIFFFLHKPFLLVVKLLQGFLSVASMPLLNVCPKK